MAPKFGLFIAQGSSVQRRIAGTDEQAAPPDAETRLRRSTEIVMQQFDFLVIESDEARIHAVMSALHFLGYNPQHGKDCVSTSESTHAWRAVYVGQVDDAAEAERQFSLLGTSAAHVPVLLAEDSPWVERLGGAKSPFAGRVATLGFPLSYEKLTE